MPPVRLLVVDDHEPVRQALRRLLTAAGFEICGEAADGREAIHAARTLQPDLVILDLFMPGMSGIDAAQELRKEFPAMLIMLLTTPDPDIMTAARRAGIRGTVSKSHGQIVNGIRAMLDGEEFHQSCKD